eukprot:1148453-Pelagomonas_calceolata.AAC.6
MLAAIQQSKVSYQVCSAYQRGVKRGVHHHHHRHHHHHIHCGRCAPVFAVIPEAASARALAPASLPVLPAERVTGAFRMKHFDVWHNLCAMKVSMVLSWHTSYQCRVVCEKSDERLGLSTSFVHSKRCNIAHPLLGNPLTMEQHSRWRHF